MWSSDYLHIAGKAAIDNSLNAERNSLPTSGGILEGFKQSLTVRFSGGSFAI
tara:strand:- start:891 stop:1046 length:156 start_codon:yes stop_codon:yes gene_type:complete